MLEKAKKDADKIKREQILEAKEEAHKIKLETEKVVKEKKNEIKEAEERLLVREGNMDRRDQTLQNREQMLEEKENNLINKQKSIQDEQVKVEEIKNEQIALLEKIAGYSKKQAKEAVMSRVEKMMDMEIASYIKDREAEAKLEVDKKAKSMLVTSMQKYAGDVANEQTVTVVALPNDDMKGRIIGREGRNIRTIEAVTGVDLIIDDTPEAIVLSSFDPLRREIARVAIETLIKDGRIHPARIEEVYDKMCNDVNQKIKEYGKNAMYELGLSKIDAELIEKGLISIGIPFASFIAECLSGLFGFIMSAIVIMLFDKLKKQFTTQSTAVQILQLESRSLCINCAQVQISSLKLDIKLQETYDFVGQIFMSSLLFNDTCSANSLF